MNEIERHIHCILKKEGLNQNNIGEWYDNSLAKM